MARTNNPYEAEALRYARYAFSRWQREPSAPSYGCFDREYWGWKKKDMPDAALQAAVSLCLRAAEREGVADAMPPLLDGYVDFMERIQHRDGSFDQLYPNEKAPGVVHDILTSLVSLWQSPRLSEASRSRLGAIMERAVDYTLRSDEKHGEIANHFAHYAWELIHYGRTFGNDRAVAYGQRYLDRTLALFNEVEGWFREYDGADAGYQTRCIAFLSRIADLTADESLWAVIHRAAGFLERLTMPTGALHPMLGTRSTAITYVSAFERLAARHPAFAALADRIAAGWASGAGLTPSVLDFENGLRIADDALDAAEIRERRLGRAQGSLSPAEAETDFDLPDAGLSRRVLIHAGGRRIIHVASRLAGTVVVHDETADGAVLTAEDAGYLLVLADGTRWVMRHADSSRNITTATSEISLTAGFTRALHEDMRPLQLIVLRLLNLTVLRSQWLGDIFKKLVVRRLISGRTGIAVTCRRTIAIAGGTVSIEDRLAVEPEVANRLTGVRIFRCRRTLANHMASSRYFQPDELRGSQPWTEELPPDVLDGRPIRRVIAAR